MKPSLRTCIIIIAVLSGCSPAHKGKLSWTHYTIDNSTPGTGWGMGGPAVADYDHDGDMDVAISRRTTSGAYWYERINDSIWTRHMMGKSPGLIDALGAAALDIDRDGWTDIVFNKIWFKNPGTPFNKTDSSWIVMEFNGGGHDIIPSDINQDGKMDIVMYNGDSLAWFDPSNKMSLTLISSGNHDHGGIAPNGAGDIDGDGAVDLVIPGFWFKNPGSGTGTWEKSEWPYEEIPRASYGRSMRVWIIDVNNDGKADIVYSHCDTGGSHAFWVENLSLGKKWESHKLPDPPTRDGDVPGTGSFHSLGVADFDMDNDLDIFAGEQEDPDTNMVASGKVAMKPVGLKERGVIWLNDGKKFPGFIPKVIHIDNPGWHDSVLIDVEGDGDIDIITKIWNADGPNYHVDFWRNDIIPPKK